MVVVDDEPIVRSLVAEMLAEMGFDVRQAESASAALSLLQRGVPVSTLITDIRMPVTTGIELASEVRRQFPGVRIVYMTGYAKEAVEGSHDLVRQDVLFKPFTFEQLERIMHRIPKRH